MVASGIEEFVPGDHVFFMPYHRDTIFTDREYLVIPDPEVVASFEPHDHLPTPRSKSVMIAPEYTHLRSPSGLLVTSHRDIVLPQKYGQVVRCGGECAEGLHPGDRVIMPPTAGHEIGWHDGNNYYFIREKDILAKC